MSYTILHGNVLDHLRQMPDESVHCCVTSPPYWGLRDYGIDPVAWGGDPAHDHVWGPQIITNATNHVDKRRWNHARNGRGEEQPIEKRVGWKRQDIAQGAFCECGAWCGSLGLEPDPNLFSEHMVEIFAEVRRVLRDDGTLWLNLGDSYCNSDKWGGGGANTGKHTKSTDGSVPSWTAVRRKWGKIEGLKPKDLVGVPWLVAFALRADGWFLRSDVVWHKPNPMPESVTDRPTKAHEYLFLLSKSERYYYDAEAIQEPASPDTHARYARGRSGSHKWADGGPGNQTIATNKPGSRFAGGVNPKCAEPGSGIKQNTSFSAAVKDVLDFRNKRSVWTIPTQPTPEAHFATFPEDLVRPCILAGCPPGGTVLDPFVGSGTTLLVAEKLGCHGVGIELKSEYISIAKRRLAQPVLELLGQRDSA